MANPNSSIPKLGHQPPTVDFIDNRLPKYHQAFVNPPVRYDPMTGKYAPRNPALVPRTSNGTLLALGASAAPPNNNGLPPRPTWANTNAMDFWNGIFPDAMAKFRLTTEPKGQSKSAYRIRDKNDWDAVYDVLEEARTKYQDEGGPAGLLRKVRRKAADSITPVAEAARIASKLLPNDPYSTPVLGAVEVLLDAVKTAASVRNQALTCFDGVVLIFSDVELFLGTFRGDANISKASIDLTVTTLDAIERAVGFFTKNSIRRAGNAFFSGRDYEKSLVESLDAIKKQSEDLMKEAAKSHIHEFHMYSQETQKFQSQILEEIREGKNYISNLTDGMNAIQHLLLDHQRQMDQRQREYEILVSQTLNSMHQNMLFVDFSNVPPGQNTLTAQAPVCINQEALRRTLDVPELDLADATFVVNKKTQLPPRQLAQAEGIINSALFRDWIVAPRSTKLLVQWDSRPPRTVAGVSPLSVFCTTMAQALRSNTRFLSAVWFCGRHVDAAEPGARVGARPMLASLIDQLLRQHAFDLRLLSCDVDPTALQFGGLDELIKLLDWLVRRLPSTTTLVCIVDGVALFERDEFWDDAFPVFSSLLNLTTDPSVPTAVKVLFTSMPGTETVRVAFEEENLILNVDTLPRLAYAPSEERMARQLGEGLGNQGETAYPEQYIVLR